MNVYRRNVLGYLAPLLAEHGPFERALDFGCGDGWFAEQLRRPGYCHEVVAVDVQRRRSSFVEPLLYDGTRLPFRDSSFPLTYAVDVLHHCPEPEAMLAELLRVTSGYLLLKDHTYQTNLGRIALAVLDEIGNRRFGVPSLYRYQHGWEWLPTIEQNGFERLALLHPLRCETRPPISWFSHHLQFLGLWKRH